MIFTFDGPELGIGLFDFDSPVFITPTTQPIRGCVHINDMATTDVSINEYPRTNMGINDYARTTVKVNDEAC